MTPPGPAGGGLRVEGLACARGGVPVLEGVSFEVAPGAALLLRGPNGAGKTTLLRTLAGLSPAAAGTVAMPVGGAAYAGHLDGLKAALTVAENLSFWADLHGRGWDEGMLDAFDLRRLRDRPAGALSAGQARRAGLARLAVVGRPVLLLDEPLTALDASHAAAVLAWLRDSHLARGGLAVIAAHGPVDLDAAELDVATFRARAPVDAA